MNQIFIFSLPRSGSTLLQRSLMSHEKIASTSETWLMLPQIYSLKSSGHLSEYGSLSASRAINDVIKNLPNGEKDYNNCLKEFITNIHTKLAGNKATYFLDKTPRYFLIIDEIIKIFPNAKFIFLFRSPEQVFASMLKTWGNNRFKGFLSSHDDLINGFEKLAFGYKKYEKISIALKYEDFVSKPDSELKRITDYLDISFEDRMISDFAKQQTKGRLGDQTGIKDYNSITDKSIDKWKKSFNSRFRKRIAIKTINKLDDEAFIIQGYDKKQIIATINKIKSETNKYFLRDLVDYLIDLYTRKFNLQLFFSKDFKWSFKKYIS